MAPVGKSWAELMNEAASAPDTGFQMLEEDDYAFFIKEVKAQKSNDGLKDQLVIIAAVEAGERRNSTVRHQMTLSPESPKALQIFFRELAVFGLDGAFFDQNPQMDMNFIASQLKNRRFSASVVHNITGDKKYANLHSISAPAGPAPQAGVPGGLPTQGAPAGMPGMPQGQAPQAPQNQYVPPQNQQAPMIPQGGTGGGWSQTPPPPPPSL